jgi:hypothetical protein
MPIKTIVSQGRTRNNTDLMLAEARASQDSNQSPTMTFQSCLEALQSCISFCAEEHADPSLVLRLFETAIQAKQDLNPHVVTVQQLQSFLENLVEILEEGKQDLEEQAPQKLSTFCLHFLRTFFHERQQSSPSKQYFLPPDETQASKITADVGHSSTVRGDEEVNDIIMKIELKKFQKLIENRIQRKNALLNNDLKRMYPICTYPDQKMEAAKDTFKVDSEVHSLLRSQMDESLQRKPMPQPPEPRASTAAADNRRRLLGKARRQIQSYEQCLKLPISSDEHNKQREEFFTTTQQDYDYNSVFLV